MRTHQFPQVVLGNQTQFATAIFAYMPMFHIQFIVIFKFSGGYIIYLVKGHRYRPLSIRLSLRPFSFMGDIHF